MTKLVVAPGVKIKIGDLFPSDGLNPDSVLSGLLSQTGSLDILGQGEIVANFSELVTQVGDRTIRYVGDIVSTVTQHLLGSTSGVTGSIGQIIVEEAGDVIAMLDLDDALDIDLGEVSSLGLLGLDLGDILGGGLDDLLGDVLDTVGGVLDVVDEPVDTVLDTVQDLIDNLAGNGDSGGTPTNGDDTLIGGDDDDDIDAMGGDDEVYGGGGNDTLHGGNGNDTLFGGSGNDELFGDDGNDILHGGPGRDRLHGGDGNDQIFGEGAGDKLFGDDGTDMLMGSRGKDKLKGGTDDDVLIGNKGRDILFGGDGADDFVFTSVKDSRSKNGIDIIRDFRRSEGDEIDVSDFGNFDFIGRGRFTGHDDELRIARRDGDTFVLGDTNGDGKADFTLHLDDRVRLTADDFIL